MGDIRTQIAHAEDGGPSTLNLELSNDRPTHESEARSGSSIHDFVMALQCLNVNSACLQATE
jgi:hypothetical protein